MAAIRRGEARDSAAVYLLARQFVLDGLRTNRDEFEVAFANVVRPRENETNVLYVATVGAADAGDAATVDAAEAAGGTGGEQTAPGRGEAGEIVVGYSLMTVSRLLHAPGLTAHLQEIVVAPEHREHGIGSELVQVNELYCRARGVRQLTMATSRAGGFYERLGYRESAAFYKKIFAFAN